MAVKRTGKGGRGSRARTKERRAKVRKARKAAQRALYESRRNAGTNQKSKRFVKKSKAAPKAKPARISMMVRTEIGSTALVERKVHGGPICGNIGCRRCSPLWKVA
jgi:hypothetical protein